MVQDLFWNATLWALTLAPRALADVGNTSGDVGRKIQLFDPLQGQSIQDLLNTILQGLTVLAIPVVAIMVIIGAYYIITSGGNPGKRAKGKDYILYAAVGFAILLLATSVSAIVSDFIAR